jgi:hypothetical protein
MERIVSAALRGSPNSGSCMAFGTPSSFRGPASVSTSAVAGQPGRRAVVPFEGDYL